MSERVPEPDFVPLRPTPPCVVKLRPVDNPGRAQFSQGTHPCLGVRSSAARTVDSPRLGSFRQRLPVLL